MSSRSALLLLKGFLLAIVLTAIAALLARAVGWIDTSDVTAARPLTGFIWRPDRWSAVVAVLAGVVTLVLQRFVWRTYISRTHRAPSTGLNV